MAQKATEQMKGVIVVKDLTPTQRVERRKRRERVRNAEAGEEPNRTSNRNREAMEVGATPLPSPILAESSLSQLNIHTESEVFEDDTVVNQQASSNVFNNTTEAGDYTVVGGYRQDARGVSPASSTLA